MKVRLKTAWNVFLIGLILVAGLFFGGTLMGVYTGIISESIGVSRSLFSINSTMRYLVAFGLNISIYKLISKIGLKRLVLLGIGATALMLFIFSRGTSLPTFYIAGIIGGFGSCFAGIVPASIMIRHRFPSSQGVMLAIASSMTGVAGIVITPIVSRIISASSWRTGFTYLSAAALVILVIEWIFLGAKNIEAPEKGAGSRAARQKLPEREEYEKKFLFLMMLISALFTLGALVLYSNVAVLLQDIGFSQVFATGTAVSIVSFANIFGKFVMGRLCDKYNVNAVLIFWYIMCVVAALYFIVYRGQSLFAAIPGILCIGFVGGIYSIPQPILAGRICKREDTYTQIMGYCTGASNLCGEYSALIIHNFYDVTGTYVSSMLYVAILAVICVIGLTVLLKGIDEKNKAKRYPVNMTEAVNKTYS